MTTAMEEIMETLRTGERCSCLQCQSNNVEYTFAIEKGEKVRVKIACKDCGTSWEVV